MASASDTPGDGGPTTKNTQILEAACRLFLEQGYEVTSMDAIAAEAGVSKRTVYSHFRSKEVLFTEIMETMCGQFGMGCHEEPDPSAPPECFLRQAAGYLLSKIMDPNLQSVMRTIAAETAAFPEMGTRFWRLGPGNMREMLTGYLRAQDAAGTLSVPDPVLSAAMFQGMVAGPQFLPMLFTGDTVWTAQDSQRIAAVATEAFLIAHRRRDA